jgi:hypothetical protein
LRHPLGSNQLAPYLFLVGEKAAMSRFGLNEHGLRLLPFLASLASLALFAWVARSVLSPTGAAVGTALFACCPMLIRYGAEVKPSAGDAMATLVMLSLVLFVIRSGWVMRRIAVLTTAGAVLLWASYPLAFVLAGIGTTAIIDRLLARQFRQAAACAAGSALWLTSFAAVYRVMGTSDNLTNEYLTSFWEISFARVPPHSLWDLRQSVELFDSMFVDPLGLAGAGLGALLFACGIGSWAARDWRWASMCICSNHPRASGSATSLGRPQDRRAQLTFVGLVDQHAGHGREELPEVRVHLRRQVRFVERLRHERQPPLPRTSANGERGVPHS